MAKKKTAKKTTAKKAKPAKKKAVKKAQVKKVEIKSVKKPGEAKATYDVKIQTKKLGQAPQEYHFVLKSGERLKSIQELASALESMGEDVFKHHVTEAKNDFASWINDVFNEENLAKDIRAVEDRVETELKLLRHVMKKLHV